MDFSLPYTEEQERFRKEVRAWLEENIPEEMKTPVNPEDATYEQHLWWLEKNKEIGKKGWLWPEYPKEYGGGGLDGDHQTILQEEFRRARVQDVGSYARFAIPGILVWGTEEQKQKFLRPILMGEKTAYQKFTEPQAGTDLANYQTKAVRDGDDWVITGQNVFNGGGVAPSRPDFLIGPAMTDPNAPRHRNLGYFVIPSPSPGLEIRNMALLNNSHSHFIFLDNVRVPGENLIGGDHQGWQVANSGLELEHGGGGAAFPRNETVENLVQYVRTTRANGGTLGQNSVVQQATMQNCLEDHVQGLLARRTFWMYNRRQEVVYEGNEANVHGRESRLRIAMRAREVMGMYSLLGTRDPRAAHGGAPAVRQMGAAGQNHAAGSTNIAKVVLARRIGISRTKERPAPTPATAGRVGS